MKFEDIRKLATGTILFDLNRIIAPRIVTIVYLLGLAAIALWAINHFFLTFSFGFGSGLWGLLEILIFGLLAMMILRVACEAVIVYFKAHASEAEQVTQPRGSASLIDDVRDAIEDLAEQEPDFADDDPVDTVPPAASVPDPSVSSPTPPPAKSTVPTPPPPAPPPTPPVAAPKRAAPKAAAAKTTASRSSARPAAKKRAPAKKTTPKIGPDTSATE